MNTTSKKHTSHHFSGRPHYQLKDLMTWTEDALVEYILFTMQRKGVTEFSTSLFPGYFGKKYDRPQGWHLLFWPFLGGYHHKYEWTRVFIENDKLMFELEEEITKSQYDFEDIPVLNTIFPAPAGETIGERYYPKKYTHYATDEFFDMLPNLPIKKFKPWSKRRYLAEVASNLQYHNPLREQAEKARRTPMTDAQLKVLIDAPIFKLRPLSEIKQECFSPKQTKFSRQLLWISIIVSIPVGIFLYKNQYQVESQLNISWEVATLIFFGIWFSISLLIDFFANHIRVCIK